MSENVYAFFTSYKISKIRWKPEIMDDSQLFVSGSGDEEDNTVTLWYYPINDIDMENLPVKKASLKHDGDVTGLEFVNPTKLVCGSSHGSLRLVECSTRELHVASLWDKLHTWGGGHLCPSTGISCFEEDVVSVGEDGRIVLLTIGQELPVRVINGADSCPLQCVCFLKHSELVTGNLRGQMKIWDLRAADDIPLSTFMPSTDGGSTSCVTNHPTQRHLLLAGGEDGAVTVWDLRKSSYPVNVLNAHSSTVTEIKFHQERPEYLFTCSFGGDVWQWNASRNMRDVGREETPWLSSDATKHRMEISSLLPKVSKPVNSLDVNRSRLLSGCDNEAIYLIKNLVL